VGLVGLSFDLCLKVSLGLHGLYDIAAANPPCADKPCQLSGVWVVVKQGRHIRKRQRSFWIHPIVTQIICIKQAIKWEGDLMIVIGEGMLNVYRFNE
jgi:hypothetical protein